MRVLVLILISFGYCVNGQSSFIQGSQLPLHYMPAMAGASEKHRIALGTSWGTNSDQLKGYQLMGSYDQRIKSWGVGVYAASRKVEMNPVEESIKSFKGYSSGSFKENIRSNSFGISVTPKINLGAYGKVKYTLSPGLFLETSKSTLNQLDQFNVQQYQKLINDSLVSSELQYLEFVSHKARIHVNSIGFNVLFNAPIYYIAFGVRLSNKVIQEESEIHNLGTDNSTIHSFYKEGVNAQKDVFFGAGITLPKKPRKHIGLTLSSMTGIRWHDHYYNRVEEGFVGLQESVTKPLKPGNSSISFLFRYHEVLVGAGVTYYEDAINTGASVGIQKNKFRILASYNPLQRSVYSGSLETSVLYKF
jgi:hypothetical protein